MGPRIRIDPAVFLIGACTLLVLPLSWLAAAVAAAVFHELCHYTLIRLCGARVNSIMIQVGGAVMETSPMEGRAEAICAAAGPLGSLFLLLFARMIPLVALCAAVQGIYNLLPVYPLDGGRILRCLVSKKMFQRIEASVVILLLLAGMVCSVYFRLGMLPVLMAIVVLIKVLARKFPCKEGQIGVQ